MVYYFKARGGPPPGPGEEQKLVNIYMGKDKFENEDLIKYGLPNDVWFHVDRLSSAHVYIRLSEGMTFDTIPQETLEDCCQLVKANSIQGNKQKNVDIVYTPWENLRKSAGMEIGEVSFHNEKLVKKAFVAQRINEIVNRLNKSREESYPNLEEERAAYDQQEKERRKALKQQEKKAEIEAMKAKKVQAELKTYSGMMKTENMVSNRSTRAKNKTIAEMEEDFM